MGITVGSQLGSYEITALLGKGGMGEVYRARDTKLKREVAIKILPDEFSRDADRVARFQREAESLAALNHQNIGAIYDLQEAHNTRFLVLELIEGETLADIIGKRGALAADEVFRIGQQICDALEAAHEKGIVHRDLKPANVKITPDGKVKVLDFGLAKAMDGSPAASVLSNSPTLVNSLAGTNAGVIIGTAAYMSPEQARGFAADQRSDVFALGCGLYEMLTGRQAFQGDTVSDILASVLARDPDLSLLPKDLNPRIRGFLSRCLEKNRKRRWHCVGDLRAELEALATQPTVAEPPAPAAVGRNYWKLVAVVLFLALTALAAAVTYFRDPETQARVARFSVALPDQVSFGNANLVAISPDGSAFAFVARDATGKFQLWTQSMDSLSARPVSTDGAGPQAIWSPDSRSIAFAQQGKLKRVEVNGSGIQTICDAQALVGGTWNAEGVIVFAPSFNGPLYRVSATGGQPVAVTQLKDETSHRFPHFLPNQRHFLYFAAGGEKSGVFVGDLESTTAKYLLASDTAAAYVEPGYLLLIRQGILLAQKFDPDTLTMTGAAQPIAEPVYYVTGSNANGLGHFSASKNGILAYRAGTSRAIEHVKLMWVDRNGRELEQVGTSGPYRGVELSPDEKKLAVHRHDLNGGDIWIYERDRPAPLRLTFDATQDNSSPIWSPDGKDLAFASLRNGMWGVYQEPVDGSGEDRVLFQTKLQAMPMSWSADNAGILFWQREASSNIWTLPFKEDLKPQPFLNAPYNEQHPQISPDGRWLSYNSDETGRSEINVRPYPSGPGKWQVSTNGGTYSRWRPDGKELFYMTTSSKGKMMSVEINTKGGSFEYGAAKPLFDSLYENYTHPGGGMWHTYDVTRDGQKFMIPRPVESAVDNATGSFVVVLNWPSLLKK